MRPKKPNRFQQAENDTSQRTLAQPSFQCMSRLLTLCHCNEARAASAMESVAWRTPDFCCVWVRVEVVIREGQACPVLQGMRTKRSCAEPNRTRTQERSRRRVEGPGRIGLK